MLYTLISSQLFVEKKSRFLKVIPVEVHKLWNEWELRLAVLLSLFFQILLILLGDRRKSIKRFTIQISLWIAYLCADWVAAVALGILSHSTEEPKINQLPAFWAPFLLLHLGGPDTITAFSLEDNELWLRHLLGLGVQGSIASYVSYRSWSGTMVSFLSALMYGPAIVKYGERTWVLSSASKEHMRDSMLDPADPGPSYAKFMDEYNSKEEEGFRVTIGRIEVTPQRLAIDQPRTLTDNGNKQDDSNENDDAEILVKGYYFFETFKRLFAFLILSFEDWNESKSYFQQISPRKAFKLIDVELGFMFDLLYTKATVVHSIKGCILRSISFSFTIFVFVIFLKVDKHPHPPTDVIITYLLLTLAIILEIYAAIILIFSDSAYVLLRKYGPDCLANLLLKCRCPCKRTRWSNSVAQYNLLSVWLNDRRPKKAICRELWNRLGIQKKTRNYWYTKYKDVPEELKEIIFVQLRRKSYDATSFDETKSICKSRGDWLLQNKNSDYHQLHDWTGWSIVEWSISKVEFDQSILIWHIATELCFHGQSDPYIYEKQGEMCKLLSDYMMYLLLVCPFMLPEGIGEIRSRDTEIEATNFFNENDPERDIPKACKFLLGVETDIPPIEVKGPKSKSVLFDACRLANKLQKLERNKRWEIISQVWVEMLSYAAVQCKGTSHAQQLGQGGELLTHVWLLMAHLGISEQFQMPTGFARKLMYR